MFKKHVAIKKPNLGRIKLTDSHPFRDALAKPIPSLCLRLFVRPYQFPFVRFWFSECVHGLLVNSECVANGCLGVCVGVSPSVISVLDYSKGFGHTDLVTAEGPMGVTIRSGAVYFAIVFLVGFALGALRTLVMAPRPSDTLAVLLEAPVILTVGWFVATWCIGRFKVPAATPVMV